MSPAGSRFRQRCRMNPAIVSCCAIDWYTEWDREAMMAVAQAYFHRLDFHGRPNEDIEVRRKPVYKGHLRDLQMWSVFTGGLDMQVQ